MTETEQKDTEQRRPMIFLILALVAMVLALLSYIFEQTIYDLTGSVDAFLYILVISVVLALFFMAAHRFPRLGRWAMGYGPTDVRKDRAKAIPMWSFGGMADSGIETKRAATRRKSDRHQRREIARATGKLRGGKASSSSSGSSDDQ